jgi:hypothetical protein
VVTLEGRASAHHGGHRRHSGVARGALCGLIYHQFDEMDAEDENKASWAKRESFADRHE